MNAPVKPKRATKAAAIAIPAIKGFNHNLQCRGFQFEPGKAYNATGTIKACANGFHACPSDAETSPLAVFEYYPPGTSRYFDVALSGATDRDGSKIAAASITLGVEVSVGALVARFVDWIVARAKPTGAAANSGDCGAASNSGTRGAASNSGDCGAAFSHAPRSRVMCEGDGQALYCTEFSMDGSITSVAAGITGCAGIKAGTWYHCRNGALVEFTP
jgi:hypothetical protein